MFNIKRINRLENIIAGLESDLDARVAEVHSLEMRIKEIMDERLADQREYAEREEKIKHERNKYFYAILDMRSDLHYINERAKSCLEQTDFKDELP